MVALGLAAVEAQERLVRRIQSPTGLPVAPVSAIVQDSHGFLWIGSVAGLVRYDGVEMRPWAPETMHSEVYALEAGPAGQVVGASIATRSLWSVTPDGVAAVTGPDGRPVAPVRDVAFGGDGRLWVVRDDGTLLTRDAGGDWRTWPPGTFGEESPYLVEPGPNADVLVAADHVWRVSKDGDARPLARLRVVELVAAEGDDFHAVRFDGAAWSFEDGTLRQRSGPMSRGIDIARRGRTIWVGCAEHLIGLRPGQPPDVLAARHGMRDGGRLLVDREGSLWVATFNGLLQFPEPDTLIWTEKDGLPSTHTRGLARTAEGIWLTTWRGSGRIAAGPVGVAFVPSVPFIGQIPCVDRDGRLWAYVSDQPFVEQEVAVRVDGAFRRLPSPDVPGDRRFRCTPAGDGGVWITLGTDLFRAPTAASSPRRITAIPLTRDQARTVVEDGGVLWVANADTVCRVGVASLDGSGTPPPWTCDSLPAATVIHQVFAESSGEIWLATQDAGVLRRVDGAWSPLDPSRPAGSRIVRGLVSSPRGGVWTLAVGNLHRTRAPATTGFAEERLSAWNGVPAASHRDAIELQDGTVWIGGLSGVIQVPPQARGRPASAPPVALIDVRVDGTRVARDAPLRLPFRRNRIELHFAALSYRDPDTLRYRIRFDPDDRWTASERPVFRYVELPAGSYEAEVIASLDGRSWSTEPARFRFFVLRPWYRQTWAVATLLLAVGGLLYGIHRLRLAYLLGLERHRERIARDLHDDLGSGLGSIGLLAAVAAERSSDPRQRDAADSISRTAGELGEALSDIVWSLRSGSETLEELAVHLAERAGRLFPGPKPRLRIDLPETWPAWSLTLPVRRNVQLMVFEALHNAEKHADASQVTLRVRVEDRRVRLTIEDDGRGLRATTSRPGCGLGLDSIRTRASEIGAEVRWKSLTPGTRVEIVFGPRGRR